MSTQEQSLLLEAKRLLALIDVGQLRRKEDILFVMSMDTRVRFQGEITSKQIYWLRDIKDRQLEDQ